MVEQKISKINKQLKKELNISVNNFGCNTEKIDLGTFYQFVGVEGFNSTLKTIQQIAEISHRNCAYMNCNNCPLNLMIESIKATNQKSYLDSVYNSKLRYGV